MIARVPNTSDFLDILVLLNHKLEMAGCLNLQSEGVLAEDFYGEVLNALYGWNLVNANEMERNATAIDLIDESAKLVVQVTVTCDTRKVNDTLKSEKIKGYKGEGYHLKFVFAGNQRKLLKKSTALRNDHSIAFRQDEDMLFSVDLAESFMHLSVEQQEHVLGIALREMGQSFVMTAGYVKDALGESLRSVGSKYNPSLCIRVREMDFLDALVNPSHVFKEIQRLASAAQTSLATLTEERISQSRIEARLSNLSAVFSDLMETDACDGAILDKVSDLAFCLSWDLEDLLTDIDRHEARARRLILDAKDSLDRLSSYLKKCGCKYLDKRLVLVTGDGGVGKSYYLAHLCDEAVRKGVPAFLVCGQTFLGSQRPLDQIAAGLPSADSGTVFLAELCRYARGHGGRAIIAIDAINEGGQPTYWMGQLQFLANEVARYPEALLVVSVRSACERSYLPDSLARAGSMGRIRLGGFAKEDGAVGQFCRYYGIDESSMPPLGEAYRNPLYLRIACEALSKGSTRSISHGAGLSALMELLIDSVNNELSAESRVGYDYRNSLTKVALEAIVGCKSYQQFGSVPFTEADAAIREAVGGQCSRPNRFLGYLEEEGVVSIYGSRGKERVRFLYESVGDYVAADVLLAEVGSGQDAAKRLLESSDVMGVLTHEPQPCVAETLAILIPERYQIEIFEIMGQDSERGFDYFVQSIPWRGLRPLGKACEAYVKSAIAMDGGRLATLLARIIDVAGVPTNSFNGIFLHKLLTTLEHHLRDVAWAKAVLDNEAIYDVIASAWQGSANLSDESLRPISLTLCWCFATSCREVRDKATKALSCVLIAKPSLAKFLLDEFLGVDDDYVIERLIASIYGAAANSDDSSIWLETAKTVYKFVFCGDETYPNIMIRNYTLCLIDVLGRESGGDVLFPKASVFGTSSWYDYKPTNNEIDDCVDGIRERYGEWSPEYTCAWNLVHSMTTEYGRGACAYGDFGRYVLGCDVNDWAREFEDETPEGMVPDGYLSNIALGEILRNWFDSSVQGAFDESDERYAARDQRGFERITKKYQWIALHRLVARLIDNYPLYHEQVIYDEEYTAYQEEIGRRQDECLKQKGWDFDEFRRISAELGDMNPEEHVVEAIKSPYGEDDLFNELASMRDIDPTILFEDADRAFEDAPSISESIARLSATERQDNDTLCGVLDEAHSEEWHGTAFVALRSYVTMRGVNETTSEVHLGFSSGFVAPENKDKFLGISEGHTGDDVLARELNYVYAQEFVSGIGFELSESYWNSEHLSDETQRMVSPAVYGGIWEQNRDHSLGGKPVNLDYPCRALVDTLSLVQRVPGKWFDEDGILVCLNVRSQDGTSFLIRQEALDRFLNDCGLLLCRNEYFEICSKTGRQRIWLASVCGCGGKSHYVLEDRQDVERDLRYKTWG